MKKILLLSDTHGNLDIINELVSRTSAHFVIHAGDFGFYDERSAYRLSHRELRLLISHSTLRNECPVNASTKRDQLIEIIKNNHLLGHFPEYLSGNKKFLVPVYAVWGNHEDVQVLKNIRGHLSIPNLFMLDENHFYKFSKNEQLEF